MTDNSQSKPRMILVDEQVLISTVQLIGQLPTGNVPFAAVAQVVGMLQGAIQNGGPPTGETPSDDPQE